MRQEKENTYLETLFNTLDKVFPICCESIHGQDGTRRSATAGKGQAVLVEYVHPFRLALGSLQREHLLCVTSLNAIV